MAHLTPNELRIGNWITSFDYQVQLTVDILKAIKSGYMGGAPFSPIQLNEEWLKRFGFDLVTTSKANYYFYKDDTLRFAFDKKSLLHCSIGDDGHGVMYQIIKYVHQLQNLYFALTNTELAIKEQLNEKL